MSLFGISRKFAILAVLVFGMSAIATQTAQAQDTYTGLKEFDYRMYLEEVGFPGPGEINPNPNLHIPRARIPQPKEPYPVPRTVPFNAPLPKPALESRIANQMSMKNNDSTLSKGGMACLDFDNRAAWGSQSSGFNLYDDQFAGWGPFVTDDGGYYQAENVFITMERGANRVGDLAIKFHSDMPYSAGIASPTIPTGPGDEVVVIAHYYIHNHGRDPVDWVSMAIKPASENAKCSDGCYVNGYVRGQWAPLRASLKVDSTEGVMILLQAQSPKNLDSNIYFDEIEIYVGDVRVGDCTLAPQ